MRGPGIQLLPSVLALCLLALYCGACNKGRITTSGGLNGRRNASPTPPAPIVVGTVALSVENLEKSAAVALDDTAASSIVIAPNIGVSSFTPTHYLMPIATIKLVNSGNTNVLQYLGATPTTSPGPENASADPNVATLYSCGSSKESECFIDLADNAALHTKFASPVNVPVGTYDQVTYMPACTEGLGTPAGTIGGTTTGFHVLVQGSLNINATTYYTSAKQPSGLATVEADAGLAPTTMRSCVGATVLNLSAPIVVKANEKTAVSLYLVALNAAWAGNNGKYPASGCTDPGAQQYVCAVLPNVIPVSGTAVPTIEAYAINMVNKTQISGQIVLMIDNQSHPIGAFLSPLYNTFDATITDNTGAALWDSGATLLTNADGLSYDLYSGIDPGATSPRIEMPKFRRVTHTGNLIHNGSALSYSAARE